MDELRINKIREEDKGRPIEAVFSGFFTALPDYCQYLNNLDYLKKCRVQITDNKIELFNNNCMVGVIDFDLINQPSKHCFLKNLMIEKDFLGKKYGSLLIELFNYFLRTKQLRGVLQNGVDVVNDAVSVKKKNMGSRFYSCLFFYKNHGWRILTTVNNVPNYMAYNCTDDEINELKKVYYD